jgi:secreted trypsin-like serine protease
MKTLKFIAASLIVSALSTVLHADTYTYKWTADNGTTQYTQTPPADRPYSRVKISSKSPTAKVEQTSMAGLNNSTEATAEQSAGEQALAETEAQAQQEKVAFAKQRAEACSKAKENLIVLESRPRIRVPAGDGQFKVLSEDEKQAMIEDTREIIRNACN